LRRQALKDTLLVFDAFYDLESKAKAGNKFAAEARAPPRLAGDTRAAWEWRARLERLEVAWPSTLVRESRNGTVLGGPRGPAPCGAVTMRPRPPPPPQVMKSWAEAEWFLSRPEVPKKITTTVFFVKVQRQPLPLLPLPLGGLGRSTLVTEGHGSAPSPGRVCG
jgi:hypothetical protein